MKWLIFIWIPCLFFGYESGFSYFPNKNEFILHNRPLVKINDKVISFLDVKKQMDVNFNRFYPLYKDSNSHRYEFYKASWLSTLQEMIDMELILADASLKEIKISPSALREEIEKKFGPNIMASLDQLGLTYEEARMQLNNEMIVQQMHWYKLHSKAIQMITPHRIREAYKNYRTAHPPKEEFLYQILTIKGSLEISEKAAFAAQSLLEKKNLEEIYQDLKTSYPELSIELSEDYKIEKRSLSPNYLNILSSLNSGEFSTPLLQTNRINQEKSFKIFHLKDFIYTDSSSFEEMSEILRNELYQQVSEKEYTAYLEKLKSRFHYDRKDLDDLIKNGYQPFEIR